jgi:hypothetical protein
VLTDGPLLFCDSSRLTRKSSGNTAQEVVAAKPFADLDPAWGEGMFNGRAFVGIVYSTL